MNSYTDDSDGKLSLPPVSALKWRCRRGMRELDTMLERFLANRYAELNHGEQLAFVRLLDIEDDQLWDWLSGRQGCADKEVSEIVRKIRNTD